MEYSGSMTSTDQAILTALESYSTIIEVGIGKRTTIAAELASQGHTVIATDIQPQNVPNNVTFFLDDVTNPCLDVYDQGDILVSFNCPVELQQPLLNIANEIGTDCWFTTLGNDPPIVDVTIESIPNDTLYKAINPP